MCNTLSQPFMGGGGNLRARRSWRQCGCATVSAEFEVVRLYQRRCLCEFMMYLRKWWKNPPTVTAAKAHTNPTLRHVLVGERGLCTAVWSPLVVAPLSLAPAGPTVATERRPPAAQLQPPVGQYLGHNCPVDLWVRVCDHGTEKSRRGEHMRPCCAGARRACGAAVCHDSAHLSFHCAPC